MKTNCLTHYLSEFKMGSEAMLMADVADLIPEFRHVCLADWDDLDNPAEMDPDLDMYLKSRGVVVEYGAESKTPDDSVMDIFYSNYSSGECGIELGAPCGGQSFIMGNYPVYDRYAKIRNRARGNMKFHIGLLFGESSIKRQFLCDMADNQPKDSTLFVTTRKGHKLPGIYDQLFKEEQAYSCPYGAGVINKYLEWLDVMAMPEGCESDRLKLEAEASGIPVITGNIAHILVDLDRLRTDRELYKQARRDALLDAAGKDMAFEIIKLKTKIGKALSCNISSSQSGQEFLHTLIKAEGSI